MSKVKLIVRPRNSLGDYRVIEVDAHLDNDEKVESVVTTDFDPNEKGERQVSDNVEPVIYIENMNTLTGMVLTVVEASIQDKEQREAFKSLMRRTVWDWFSASHEDSRNHWYKNRKNYTTIKD